MYIKKFFSNLVLAAIIISAATVCFASCKKTDSKSSECNIESFTVLNEAWKIGAGAGTSASPIVISPNAASVAKSEQAHNLSPVITISRGAKLNHALSGQSHNFSNGATVTFIVTAEDGKTTKTYRATGLVQ